LQDQDFEILFENEVDLEALTFMEIEDIRRYIELLKINKREGANAYHQ